MKKYIYHYCAVSGNSTLSGIAQLPFRIKSQEDLCRLKDAINEFKDGFCCRAITSLSYLGTEEVDDD